MTVRRTGRKLSLDHSEWVLFDEPPNKVSLSAGSEGESISEADTLIIGGREYSSFESAILAGRRWRQIMAVYFARVGFSVDLGDDREELCTPREVDRIDSRTQPGFTDETIIYWDRIGLYVLPIDPSAIFYYGQAYGQKWIMTGQAKRPLQAIARHNQNLWSDELKLAYELFHASLADANPETKFILAVTSIEALIPRQERIPEIVTVLNSLIDVVNRRRDEYGRETANSVKQLLHSDKSKSIRSIGLRLADRLSDTYDGLPPRAYFDHIYKIRSELAHGELRNIWRLSPDALNDQIRELNRFVLDILAAWTPEHSTPAPQIER